MIGRPSPPMSTRCPHGLVLLLALCTPLGCTKKPSRLETASKQIEADNANELQQAQAALPQLPSGSAPPEGVPAQLWTDLHWLPTDVAGINGTGPGHEPFIAHWFFGLPTGQDPDCKALQEGLSRGYGIEWSQPPQSFVLFGSGTLEQVEGCAKAATSALRGSAHVDKDTLFVRTDMGNAELRFATQGEQLVLVIDDGRLGRVADAQANRLRGDENLMALLTKVDPARATWSATTNDMTQVPVGVPSLGYTLHNDGPNTKLELRFAFESSAEAERALAATPALFEKMEAMLGKPVERDLRRDAETVTLIVDPAVMLAMPPEKLAELNQTLEALAAERAGGPDPVQPPAPAEAAP
ncbi:MAG: hypothetical protein AAF799_19370 [Myxococcota bacterium]